MAFDRKEFNRQWNRDHREKCLECHRKWRKNKENREKELKQNREYQRNHKGKWIEYNKHRKNKRNPELHNEYMREWRKTEKGKSNNQRGHSKRRVREREIINTLTSEEWINILKQHDFKCVYCGKKLSDFFDTTRDHIIPISKGGHNIKENVVPSCRSCNAKKSNKINKRKEGEL